MAENESMQKQIADMQKLLQLQLQAMQNQTQMQMQNPVRSPTLVNSQVKQVNVPEGRYNMTLQEYRTYKKDCIDYKKLTNYSDEQVVLQMRLNMDGDLKRAIDTNYGNDWDSLLLNEALKAVGEIIHQISNPVVYRKEFDKMHQKENEPIREFVTRLKSCATDCDFQCPYDESHNLTDYHIINKIRSSIYNTNLQQELLQKSDTLTDLTSIIQFCENFEAAKKDKDLLTGDHHKISLAGIEIDDISKDEMIAAISMYRISKKYNDKGNNTKCSYCGYSRHTSKQNCPAQGKTCKLCGKKNHFEQVCRSNKNRIISSFIISTIERIMIPSKNVLPTLNVMFQTKYLSTPKNLIAIADTGAQVNVAGDVHAELFGLKEHHLTKPRFPLRHAGGDLLNVRGCHEVTIIHNDKTFTTDFYFVSGVENIYLSLDSCKKMCIIDQSFPHNTINAINTDVNSTKNKKIYIFTPSATHLTNVTH